MELKRKRDAGSSDFNVASAFADSQAPYRRQRGWQQAPHARKAGGRTTYGDGHGPVDERFGQRGALPLFQDRDGDESDDDPDTAAALQYLQSVRSEASFLPDVFTSLRPDLTLKMQPSIEVDEGEEEEGEIEDDEDGSGDEELAHGDYRDGVYTAPRAIGAATDLEAASHRKIAIAQTIYHRCLVARFRRVRATLRLPFAGAKSVGTDSSTSRPLPRVNVYNNERVELQAWAERICARPPTSAQLAGMDMASVMWLVSRLHLVFVSAGWHSRRPAQEVNRVQIRKMGAWAWGLLARLDDVGSLSHAEVALVRELGKGAGALALGLDIDATGDDPDATALEGDDRLDASKRQHRGRAGSLHSKPLSDTRQRRNSSSSISDASQVEDGQLGGETNMPHPSIEAASTQPAHHAAQQASVHDHFVVGNRAPESLDAAKARLLADARLGDEDEGLVQGPGLVTGNTVDDEDDEDAQIATLDMMLTIVGECYGQRDLLVARDTLWTARS